MDRFKPPERDAFETTAQWGLARAQWFKDMRRPVVLPEPQFIETVRIEYVDRDVIREVEVEKIVEVERLVEVEKIVEVERAADPDLVIPEFRRRDPVEVAREALIQKEKKPWEEPAGVLERLSLEFEGLLNKSRYTVLGDEENERYRQLTSAGFGHAMAR